MDIVSRVKNIILDPRNEWAVIDGEPDDPITILKSYVVIVAAIPAICGFIGMSIIGAAGYRTGIIAGLFGAIFNYVLTLVGVFVVAAVIDALAERFGGRKNFNSAFKVAAYAPTVSWVAGVFMLIPALSVLTVLGLYSIYLFVLGLPMLMRTPADKATGYTIAVIVAVIIVWLLIIALPAMLLGRLLM